MNQRFRIVLAWLLLVALPLQGVAAATLLHCGPSQHETMAAATPPHHADAGAHHHAPGAASAGVVEDDPVSPPHDLSRLSKPSCSACAACCMGIALPATTLAFASVLPAIAPIFFVPALHVGFFTDGPDRPPRLLLA